MNSLLRPTPRAALLSSSFKQLASPALKRSYARATIIGRLTATPEEVPTSTGKQLIRYSVASSSGTTPDSKMTSYFRVASFPRDGASEAGIQYLLGLPKGTLVHVEADARLRLQDDPETGKKVQRLDLVQRSLEVLARPRPREDGEGDSVE